MTEDTMDDVTKARLSREVIEASDVVLDITDLLRDTKGRDISASTNYIISLGLREEALTKGMFVPISQMLGELTGRMRRKGLDRDAIGQVLYSVWKGREQVPELACLEPELGVQTRRCLDWALDELVYLIRDGERDQTPSVAWFVMSMTLDIMEHAKLHSES